MVQDKCAHHRQKYHRHRPVAALKSKAVSNPVKAPGTAYIFHGKSSHEPKSGQNCKKERRSPEYHQHGLKELPHIHILHGIQIKHCPDSLVQSGIMI